MNKKALLKRYCVHQGLHWSIIGIAIPVLVLIFQSRGLNFQDIGVVMAVWVGSTAALEIPLGGIADKYGRRNIYLLSLVVNVIGCLTLYFASDSFLLIITAAFFLGTSRAIYSGTLDAWFYDTFHTIRGELTYHKAISIVNVMVTIGLAIGSLVGGWLPDYVVSLSINLNSIYDLNLILMCIANLSLFFISFVLISEEKVERYNPSKLQFKQLIHHSLKAIRVSFSHIILKRIMQTTLVFGFVLSSVEAYWQPYLSEVINNKAYGVIIFGFISALYFLMAGTSSLLSVPLLRLFKNSHRELLFVTRSLSGVFFIFLALSDTVYSFIICYLIFFFLFTAGNNSEMVLLNDNTDEERRSTMLSISSSMVTIGSVVASLFLGYVSEQYGIVVNWIACGFLLISSSLLFLLVPAKEVKAVL
ncbi:MFS transporter [Vibrio sp. AK197]